MSKIRTKFIKLLAISAVCSAFFGCAAPKVKQRVLMPANAGAMVNAKKVAVLNFHGDRNEEFTRELELFFTNIMVENKPYFHVVDHDAMYAIISDQFLVPQNVLDDAAKLEVTGDVASILSAMEGLASGVSKLAPGLDKLPPPPGLKSHRRARAHAPRAPGLPSIDLPKYVFKPADAITLGQLSGADTILTGVVKWPAVKNSPYEEERSRCVKTEKKSSVLTPGIKTKTCVQYEKHKVNCIKQVSNIEFAMKAVNVQNSEIAFMKRYEGAAENKYCSDTKSNKMEPAKLSQAAISNAIGKLRHDVAPYIVVLSIDLMKKDDSKLADNKQAKMLLDEGLSMARHGRMDRACDDFNRAEQAYNQSAALYYNLGVCAEVRNDLDTATQLYNQANTLTSKHNRVINQALYRVEDRRKKAALVAEQLH